MPRCSSREKAGHLWRGMDRNEQDQSRNSKAAMKETKSRR